MKTIDFSKWPRYKHFLMFKDYDYPHFNLTATVDVTSLMDQLSNTRLSFTVVFTYMITRAANDIPEFRQRIRGENVVEYERVNPSITILSLDDLFSFCTIPYTPDFGSFYEHASFLVEKVKTEPNLEDEPGKDDLIFLSSLPWVAFTGLSHPIHMHPVDSIPRITWGKFIKSDHKINIPVSVQGHHSLMDGIHMGIFYQNLQDLCTAPTFLTSDME